MLGTTARLQKAALAASVISSATVNSDHFLFLLPPTVSHLISQVKNNRVLLVNKTLSSHLRECLKLKQMFSVTQQRPFDWAAGKPNRAGMQSPGFRFQAKLKSSLKTLRPVPPRPRRESHPVLGCGSLCVCVCLTFPLVWMCCNSGKHCVFMCWPESSWVSQNQKGLIQGGQIQTQRPP